MSRAVAHAARAAATLALAFALTFAAYRTAPGRAALGWIPEGWWRWLQGASGAVNAESWADVELAAIFALALALAALIVVALVRLRRAFADGGAARR